ncbi:hypothetical protein [Vibrio spartinae]|uniref:Nicotianamine synthase protein n=1 Tax=Vibrio spartinae TaxID=1918945 RepID=A0A1N6M5V0_9VIBR|nr:hypothetical protein [Vibrio spartinae]SIO94760.1 hypothetical protein VSP9026_02490 [Vibrio spartinae]
MISIENLVCQIKDIVSNPIDSKSILSLDLYHKLQDVSEQIRLIKHSDYCVIEKFICEHQSLLSELDSLSLDYEMKCELAIAKMMGNSHRGTESKTGSSGINIGEFIEFYRQLFNAENDLLETKPRIMCHVGCGPMPSSALMWIRNSDVKIRAIDYDATAVKLAKCVFDNWRCKSDISEERVKFSCIAGEDFNYKGVDLIILSSSISNKSKLYQQIANTIDSPVQIIEREPNFLYEVNYLNQDMADITCKKMLSVGNVDLRLYSLSPQHKMQVM